MNAHRASRTDSIHSIAARYGHAWRTIWDHPKNKELREDRGAPTCLQEGDIVHIPEMTQKRVPLVTNQVHRFTRKEVPLRPKLTLRDEDGEPRGGLHYQIEIDGVVHTGTLDVNGRLDVPMQP